MTKDRLKEIVTEIYLQTKEVSTEDLKEVFNNTLRELGQNNRLGDNEMTFLKIITNAILETRKEALN